MYFILGVDDQSFYWDQATTEVMCVDNKDSKAPWIVIGHAEDQDEAKEVIMEWL